MYINNVSVENLSHIIVHKSIPDKITGTLLENSEFE